MFTFAFRRTIMLIKNRTNATKETSSRSIAPEHPPLPPISFRPFTDPERMSEGLSEQCRAGCAYAVRAEQHQ